MNRVYVPFERASRIPHLLAKKQAEWKAYGTILDRIFPDEDMNSWRSNFGPSVESALHDINYMSGVRNFTATVLNHMPFSRTLTSEQLAEYLLKLNIADSREQALDSLIPHGLMGKTFDIGRSPILGRTRTLYISYPENGMYRTERWIEPISELIESTDP